MGWRWKQEHPDFNTFVFQCIPSAYSRTEIHITRNVNVDVEFVQTLISSFHQRFPDIKIKPTTSWKERQKTRNKQTEKNLNR